MKAIRIASVFVSSLLAVNVASAQSAATFVGAGIKFVSSPLGSLVGLGAGFMDEYIYSDSKCLTVSERVTESAARAGVGTAARGAVIGGVLGGAFGGDVGSAAKGALAGVAVGGIIGAAGANRAAAVAAQDARDRDRRRTIDLCRIGLMARDMARPVLADFAVFAGPLCNVDPSRIFVGDNTVDGYIVNRCARENPKVAASLSNHLNVILGINKAACQTGVYVVAEYDRQWLDEVRRTGGSMLPTQTPDCDGRELSSQWSWLLK